MDRFVWIDWAKAIGILTVVMGHSTYSCSDIVNVIFLFHMPLFFFISGYLFKANNKRLKEVTNSSLKTLLIPFGMFNLIGLAANVLQGGIRMSMGLETEWYLRFWKPLWNTFLGKSEGMFVGPTWFLLSLIWCKYMMWIIIHGRNPIKIGMIFCIIVLLCLRQSINLYFPYAIDTACAGIIWFAIGYWLRQKEYLVHIHRFVYGVSFFIALLAEMLFYHLGAKVNYIATNMGGVRGILATVFGITMIISICKLMDIWGNKYIEAVSRASILIMCLHMMLSNYLNHIFHYEGYMFKTFMGDIMLVIILTITYPVIRRYFPILIGNRK